MSKIFYFFLYILLLLNFVITDEDYCDKSLCPSGVDHIACNANLSPGKECDKSAKVLGMTDKYRNTILQKHNAMRNQVAKGTFNGLPVASRMLTMQWDKELEILSKYNVLRCMLKNSECTNTSVYYSVGQNLAYNKFKGKQNPRKIIKGQIFMWIDEYRYTTLESLLTGKGAGDQEIGHFLQIIVDRSDRVGCSVLSQTKNDWNYQYMACKYAVAQNACNGIYKFGTTPGDGCESGLNPNYTNLCSTSEKSNYGPPIEPDETTASGERETTASGEPQTTAKAGGGKDGGDIFKNITDWIKNVNKSGGFNLSITDEYGESSKNNSISIDITKKNRTSRSGRRNGKKRIKKRIKKRSKKRTQKRTKRKRTKVRSEVNYRWG